MLFHKFPFKCAVVEPYVSTASTMFLTFCISSLEEGGLLNSLGLVYVMRSGCWEDTHTSSLWRSTRTGWGVATWYVNHIYIPLRLSKWYINTRARETALLVTELGWCWGVCKCYMLQNFHVGLQVRPGSPTPTKSWIESLEICIESCSFSFLRIGQKSTCHHRGWALAFPVPALVSVYLSLASVSPSLSRTPSW